MGQPAIQTSFNAGEWAPALNARVDLAKYHSGAALLRNFFVDYRGGATTRPGSRYVLQTFKSATDVRLIPFQASFTVSYILEFGDLYIRFFNNGSPILEATNAITGITNVGGNANLQVANSYSVGDWVFITGVVGATQLNGNYYIISFADAANIRLTDLFGNAITFASLSTYASGGATARIYTIISPYTASELSLVKYAQNVNQLILTHPNHPPYVLTLVAANNWTLAPIVFGAPITSPGISSITSTLAAGSVSYSYKATAVDANGQESGPSGTAAISSLQDLRTVAGTNTININVSVGAVSTNIYKAEPSYAGAAPSGASFGFIGNCAGTAFIDSNITPDFSTSPPVVQNPFQGSGVQSINLTATGNNYTSSPAVNLTAAPGGGTNATAVCTLKVVTFSVANGGSGYAIGDAIVLTDGVSFAVTSTIGFGTVTGIAFGGAGLTTGAPSNPVAQSATSGSGTGFTANLFWGVGIINLQQAGSGYLVAPSVSFVGGGGSGAAATTTLGAPSSGNPAVPGYFQQRLVFAGPVGNPQQFNMSQPGSQFNFNVTNPIQADNAIQGILVSGQLNTIKSMIPKQSGLIVFSDRQAWLINGGISGSGISALDIVANSEAYNGASDVPPIVASSEILYVQAKGSIVRDLSYNFYTNIYTGTDISVLSSHLFYDFLINEWAWAEEPFKVVWAVRSDGQLLSLTFLKEQELIAWAHSDTQGTYKSVATVTETTSTIGPVDAIYTIVQRVVNGQSIQYIERFVELTYPQDYKSSWQVDAGIGYNGTPATTFSGAQHLGGLAVTGLADGIVINFTMPTSGTFVFGPGGTTGLTAIANASIVTVGLSFLPQLQTLRLDLGEPTVQGKRKKITAVTARVRQALGYPLAIPLLL